MLVVCYKINDTLVGNYDRDANACSGIILIGVTGVLNIANLTFVGLMYYWFSGCTVNIFLISITVLSGIAFIVLVLFKKREDASILTSSMVFTYCLYLQWSALASDESTVCNPFLDSAQNTVFQIALGLFFTMASLFVISASTKKDEDKTISTSINQHMMEDERDNGEKLDDVEDNEGKKIDHEEIHTFPISTASIFF